MASTKIKTVKKKNIKKAGTATKKKKKKPNKKKKNSLLTGLIKLIFTALIISGISYSLFFIDIDGKTAYVRIIKIFKDKSQNKNKTKKQKIAVRNKEIINKSKNIKTKNKYSAKKTSLPSNNRKKDILRAKKRNRSLEKVAINKKHIDFINKKSISKKEKNNLNDIINSNL